MSSLARRFTAVYRPKMELAHPVRVALDPILGAVARGYRCGFDAFESTPPAALRRDAFRASAIIQPDTNDSGA